MPTDAHSGSGEHGAPAPRCVADVLPELLSRTAAAPPPETRAQESPVDVAAPVVPLPLPPAVAAAHRVQVSIRGRRYETAMDVAATYCLSFFLFFHTPFDGDGEAAAAGPLRTVGDAASDVTDADLMRHYTRRVEPALRLFLDANVAAPGEDGATTRRSVALPPLQRPVRVSYDAATHVWRFEFAARLTAAEEEAERVRRHGAGDAAAAAGAAVVPSDDVNNSPFLLLQSDYMGVLLVYLRRCATVRARREAAQGHPDATPYPTLPIRWAEMHYDEQVSLVQLLRCFGVVPLVRTYAWPTAPLSTSLYMGAEAAAAAAKAKADGDACSIVARAAKFAELQQQQQQQEQEGAKNADSDVAPANSIKVRHTNTDDDDDDDGVVLPAKGCARCGIAGHATEECTY
ncbi:hypothetical protein NESM_000685600 [Novymonas esmeraldas]|uniref:CCHC-type domain-containing protein n=1 Tax=Novymonas esmeraldas TaxID=1808958 RepID=A0AAW0EUK3_9TRYP